jgi:hypothetical protein
MLCDSQGYAGRQKGWQHGLVGNKVHLGVEGGGFCAPFVRQERHVT